jgi:hypothetical protein
MKNQLSLFTIIIFFIVGCETSFDNRIIGNWNKCNQGGSYLEFEITEKKLIVLSSAADEILVFKNQLSENKMIISEFKNGISLMINPDTIYFNFLNQNRIEFNSGFTIDNVEMKRTQVTLENIDSTNIESWKNKTINKFNKRAEDIDCKDLRTDDEKEILELELDFLEDEDEMIDLNDAEE